MSHHVTSGDNFRAVDPATAAWALNQHFAVAELPMVLPPPPPPLPHRVPSRVAQILRLVIATHGITTEEFLHGKQTKANYQARQAAYRALRSMQWGEGVPTYSQIARWCNRHPSSVHHYFEHVAPLEAKGGVA